MVTTTPAGESSAIFVDTNVLIYADLTSSPFHTVARRRLVEAHAAGTRLWISRQVVREYLVAITRGQTFSEPVPPTDAAASAERIVSQLVVANDTEEVGRLLLELVARHEVKGKQVHDANVVATMLAHGVRRLLTHNVADFDRFAGLIEVVPLVG
jgi:predicted nucleic acid-binding protein